MSPEPEDDHPTAPDGTTICAYGYCRAPLPSRRSRYCSVEHADLAKQRATLSARARQVSENYLERVAKGVEPAPTYRGWLVAQDGVVLDGKTVMDLRALSARLPAYIVRVREATQQGRGAEAVALQRELATAVTMLVSALDRVLPPPSGL